MSHPTKRQSAEQAITIWRAALIAPVTRYDVAVMLNKHSGKSLEAIRRVLVQMTERGQLNALARPGSSAQRFVAVVGMCPVLPPVHVDNNSDQAKRAVAVKAIAAARVRFAPYPSWLPCVAVNAEATV